jgi:outer membrane lipoprotein-sorting protein
MNNISILSLILSIFISQSIADDGFKLAKAMEDRLAPIDIKSESTMILTNKDGKTRISKLKSWAGEDNKKQIIWFLEPKDDRGVAFLKIEHEGGDDEMRLWLPAFKKVRRISSNKKSGSFMGSDMSYEDMTTRELDEYDYSIEGSDIVDGKECFILISIPKDKKANSYSKFKTWVTKKDTLAIKEEAYDKRDKLLKLRTIIFKKFDKYTIPVEIYVENVQQNHNTRLNIDHIEVDTKIDDSVFQEKNLKRIP